MEIYERIIRKIFNMDEPCRNFLEFLDKTIPEDSCDKDKLIAVVAAEEVSCPLELIALIEGRIHYLDNLHGISPDDSVVCNPVLHYMLKQKYEVMKETIKKYMVQEPVSG